MYLVILHTMLHVVNTSISACVCKLQRRSGPPHLVYFHASLVDYLLHDGDFIHGNQFLNSKGTTTTMLSGDMES
jgi:hypothetical protein